MKVSRERIYLLLYSILLFVLVGCDNAYFSNSRHIGGDYYLQQWEDFTTFYIEDKKHLSDFPGSGAISGVVVEIGWDEKQIIVLQDGVSGQDGWVIINIANKQLFGPYQNRNATQFNNGSNLNTMPAKVAWDKLCEREYFCW